MSRGWKLLLLVGASLALPFTVANGGRVTLNDARCDDGSGNTCCQQEEAACTDAFPTLLGYYNKGCAGACGKECPETET